MRRVPPLCVAFCPACDVCAGVPQSPTLRRRAGNAKKRRLKAQRSPAAAGKILPFGRSKLRCPTCDGTGSISLDIQFLPDVEIVCPDCGGSRYCREASMVARERKDGVRQTLPALMEMSVEQAKAAVKAAKGCVLIEDLNGRNYPTPLDTTDQDLVYVGRIRRDLIDDERGLTLWCCGDQIRKGAATNCVQIAELLVEQ